MSDNVSVCWAAAKMSLFHSCATTAPGRPTAVLFRRAWTWLFQFWPLVLLLTREWGGCLQIKALVATTACTIQKEVHSLPSLNIQKSIIYLKCCNKCVSYSYKHKCKILFWGPRQVLRQVFLFYCPFYQRLKSHTELNDFNFLISWAQHKHRERTTCGNLQHCWGCPLSTRAHKLHGSYPLATETPLRKTELCNYSPTHFSIAWQLQTDNNFEEKEKQRQRSFWQN